MKHTKMEIMYVWGSSSKALHSNPFRMTYVKIQHNFSFPLWRQIEFEDLPVVGQKAIP